MNHVELESNTRSVVRRRNGRLVRVLVQDRRKVERNALNCRAMPADPRGTPPPHPPKSTIGSRIGATFTNTPPSVIPYESKSICTCLMCRFEGFVAMASVGRLQGV